MLLFPYMLCSWHFFSLTEKLQQVVHRLTNYPQEDDASRISEGTVLKSSELEPSLTTQLQFTSAVTWSRCHWCRLPTEDVRASPWGSPRATWTWAWAHCSGCPSLSRGWHRGTQRSLPTTAILCEPLLAINDTPKTSCWRWGSPVVIISWFAAAGARHIGHG